MRNVICCPKCDRYVEVPDELVFQCSKCQSNLVLVIESLCRSMKIVRLCFIEQLTENYEDALGVRPISEKWLAWNNYENNFPMFKCDPYYEARQPIAIMGYIALDGSDNPFHSEFHNNYCRGVGKTKEEALENLKKDLKGISDSLWA